MQRKTIATSLAVLLSSVGLNALDISSAGNISGATNPTLSTINSEKVGVNINLPWGGGNNIR